MKTYQIVNKIFVQKKSKLRFLKRLLNTGMILLLLFGVFELAMKEPFWDVVSSLILPFALASYAKSRCTSSGYDSVALELTILPEEIQMVYPAINRNDGGGVRREMIRIVEADVDKIMYSDELKSIRILAKAVINVDYEKDHKRSTIDERLHNQSSEYIIYLPPNQVEDIIDDIENNFGLTIERIS